MVPSVSVAEATSLFLLDVREPDEWAAGHAPEAHHIPMFDVPARLAEIPDEHQIAVICRSGGRSAEVTQYLNHLGRDAVNVSGGMAAWQRSGFPMTAATGEPTVI